MAVEDEPTRVIRRSGRGRKAFTVLVILLIVIGGLLVAADRVAAYAAERTVARQAKQELTAQQISAAQDPVVHVSGFPFLTQVVRGRYEKITIDVVKPSAQGITLDDLFVVATGVNASTSALLNGSGQITADNAKVHITKVSVEGGGIPAVIQNALGAITQQLSFTVKIPPLPYHLKVTDVQARPEGVTITAAATDVPISGQGA